MTRHVPNQPEMESVIPKIHEISLSPVGQVSMGLRQLGRFQGICGTEEHLPALRRLRELSAVMPEHSSSLSDVNRSVRLAA